MRACFIGQISSFSCFISFLFSLSLTFEVVLQGSKDGQSANKNRPNKAPSSDNDKSCEMTFGSYCLWRREHKQAIKDAVVKKLKDRLFVARAYFPSIAKLPDQDKLSRELRLNIQEFERVLSESSRDADLPPL